MKMCARLLLLLACLAYCRGHAVVPVPVVPAAHAYHELIAAPYPLVHASYTGHGLGHGLLAVPFGHGLSGHHLLKRSPHYVAPLAHVAPVVHAPIAPVAVSHQARLDVDTSPAIVASVVPVPLVHKAVVGPLHYGAGLHGGFYPHVGHY